jgi:Common central domain of tyrosinase/von Willebrand factor type A domain
MKCRKNIRKLIQEYNASADKPNTTLMKLKKAILDLKNPAIRPSLISEAQLAGAQSRYDDFVWVHFNVMNQGPNNSINGGPGPNWAHRGPSFGPWHRQLLKLYEEELRSVSGDPNLCLPYWNWTKDRTAADPGFPFFTEFLGGDGAGNLHDQVTTGDFAQANGWDLNVDEEGFGYLRRRFGGGGPDGLPTGLLPTVNNVQTALTRTPYDSSTWNQNVASNISFRNTLEGWVTPNIHNTVHVWVSGSMLPGSSPNDPVFFFHHNNIDRLWAVWQQKHPTIAQYLPDNTTAASNGLTRLNDRMATFGRTSTDRYFGIDVTPADVINSKAITWYDSDLPEISNETGGTLSFTNIPAGLTTYKAVKFKVTGCREVRFRITGVPTGQFGLTSMGMEFTATPDDNEPFVYGYVWVQLVAVAGPIANSAVDIHAYIIDEEGYYAANEGDEFPLGDFHVQLAATTVSRADNSVALVLDRSGSMASPAGGSSTRSTLLINAVSVFNTLMLPTDEIALVSFDDQVATPVTMQAVSTAGVPGVLTGHALDPRGATCIGGGILEGVNQLGMATHTNKSLLVLTDGNENVHPYVAELPAGTITDRTYAIGFGLPGDVSDVVLNQITSNTHGDLIITGNITTTEQGFNLTKYFVQMLAGITKMNVILDPPGALFFGSREVIPFDVTAADVYLNVMTLCPLPQVIDFFLETPDGTVIKPSTAGAEANIEYVMGQQVLLYRIALPAIAADAGGSHAGKWRAIVALKGKDTFERLSRSLELAAAMDRAAIGPSVPYCVVAHVFSNLQFEAQLHQDAFKPGAAVTLTASLKEYDIPFTGNATVWAEVTDPGSNTRNLILNETSGGVYSATFDALSPGVYSCRVRAQGYSSSTDEFTREKTLTAGVYFGNYSTVPADSTDPVCEILECLLSEKVLTARAEKELHARGVDLEHLRECLKKHCRPRVREHQPPQPPPRRKREAKIAIRGVASAKPVKRATEKPKPMRMMEAMPRVPRIMSMFPSSVDQTPDLAGAVGPAPRIMDMHSLRAEGAAPRGAKPKKRGKPKGKKSR